MTEIELARTISDGSSNNLLGGILFLLVVAVPLVVKILAWSRETTASGTLYAQLAEQVKDMKNELDKVYADKHKQAEELLRVKARVEHLEKAESMVGTLKKKLDEKDRIIAERDARIASLTEEVLRMKDRVHHLELRLAQDEKEFCKGCPSAKPVVTI